MQNWHEVFKGVIKEIRPTQHAVQGMHTRPQIGLGRGRRDVTGMLLLGGSEKMFEKLRETELRC